MSSQDWMRHDHQPTPAAGPTYEERRIWTLVKGTRSAEARIRTDSYGRELRLLVDGALLWSERERETTLEDLAEQKCADFEERGWHA